MTNLDFLKMVEMDRARKAEANGPTHADMQRMRAMISPKSSGMMEDVARGTGNFIKDFGISIGRGSDYASGRAAGNSYRTSGEQRDYDESRNSKIMELLQKEKKEKAMQDYRNSQLEQMQSHRNSQLELQRSRLGESHRHNSAMEGYHNAMANRQGGKSAQDRKYEREEEKELQADMDNRKLQETDPGAFYLKALPTSERNQYIKAQQTSIKGMSSQQDAIHALKRMKELVSKNPGISNYLNKVYGPGGGGLSTLNQLRMSDKDRTALNLFDKYQKDIIKLKVEALSGSGARPNMFLEKIVSGSVGELGMTADALSENFDFSIAEMNRSINAKKKIKKDISRRIYNPYSMDSEEEAQSQVEVPEKKTTQSNGISLKAIQDAIARKKGMMQ